MTLFNIFSFVFSLPSIDQQEEKNKQIKIGCGGELEFWDTNQTLLCNHGIFYYVIKPPALKHNMC